MLGLASLGWGMGILAVGGASKASGMAIMAVIVITLVPVLLGIDWCVRRIKGERRRLAGKK